MLARKFRFFLLFFLCYTTTGQEKRCGGHSQTCTAKQASQAPKMRPGAPNAMPKPPAAPPARVFGGMGPWGPSFTARRYSSKQQKTNQTRVLFGVGNRGRGIRGRTLIISMVRRVDRAVAVWWVPHVPIIWVLGWEILHWIIWVERRPWGLGHRLNGRSLGYYVRCRRWRRRGLRLELCWAWLCLPSSPGRTMLFPKFYAFLLAFIAHLSESLPSAAIGLVERRRE